ncbi:MAG: hypothetical protein ABSF34_12800, partial [Verrucomicrobiota bacterium]
GDGVLVLMDIGSAILSSETALDLLDEPMRATVRFGNFQRTTDDRKELAIQLRDAVLKLKTEK